uniref:Uncharacterized protein n=1 Tax=viral metagenome TaxID=1070528 RepID=A0A6C0D796_9ZZZZ
MKSQGGHDFVTIYDGNFRHLDTIEKYSKVIVLDLDETIGDFTEMIILWKIVQSQSSMTQADFNIIMEIFPEFFRIGIFTILEYLYRKRQKDHCSSIYLYTNNRYSPEFPNLIAQYISYKLRLPDDCVFFDKTICAFKIGDKIIEKDRSEHKKSHNDFIRCTMLPKSTEICFIDDYFHKKMRHDKIYYIQPLPYNHDLSPNIIATRACSRMPQWFSEKKTLTQLLSIREHLDTKQYEIQCRISQKIMYYIKEFFHLTTFVPKTRKNRKNIGRFTRKRAKYHSEKNIP